jgi:hypothetical protein
MFRTSPCPRFRWWPKSWPAAWSSSASKAVESKLNLIGRTIQTSIDLVQNRRGMRVEWYIVILIVVEIVLTLCDMFVRGR